MNTNEPMENWLRHLRAAKDRDDAYNVLFEAPTLEQLAAIAFAESQFEPRRSDPREAERLLQEAADRVRAAGNELTDDEMIGLLRRFAPPYSDRFPVAGRRMAASGPEPEDPVGPGAPRERGVPLEVEIRSIEWGEFTPSKSPRATAWIERNAAILTVEGVDTSKPPLRLKVAWVGELSEAERASWLPAHEHWREQAELEGVDRLSDHRPHEAAIFVFDGDFKRIVSFVVALKM